MLQEDRHTANAISFNVDLPRNLTQGDIQIKKRLEADAEAARGAQLTIDDIQAKLKKAEQKRQNTLELNSKRLDRKRAIRVNERKASLDEERAKQNGKFLKTLSQAEEKRTTTLE
jgi:hypothetical protein